MDSLHEATCDAYASLNRLEQEASLALRRRAKLMAEAAELESDAAYFKARELAYETCEILRMIKESRKEIRLAFAKTKEKADQARRKIDEL
jgi:hypothetical protein